MIALGLTLILILLAIGCTLASMSNNNRAYLLQVAVLLLGLALLSQMVPK